MTNDARNPDAKTLAREALYICRPDGYTGYRAVSAEAAQELTAHGFFRVEFRAVLIPAYVCPVNGAEMGDEPYYARLPHRPDGQRLRLVD